MAPKKKSSVKRSSIAGSIKGMHGINIDEFGVHELICSCLEPISYKWMQGINFVVVTILHLSTLQRFLYRRFSRGRAILICLVEKQRVMKHKT